MVQAANIADLMTLTLPQFKRYKFTDISSDYRRTIAFKRVYRQKKTKWDEGDGVSIQFQLMTDTNGSFRFVGLGFTSVLPIPSTFISGSVPMRGWTYNWSVDGAEISMNMGDAKIFDIMKARYFQGVGDMIKGVEPSLWRVPSSTSDNVLGLPYYIVKSNTAATTANADGFNGLVPSGYTTVAGINPTTYPRWANYATQYTLVSKDDLIRKMRRAARKTDFQPLVEDMPTYNWGEDYGWYMNDDTYGAFIEVAESQNENLGPDVASMEGKTLFRRAPLDWVDELAKDTTNPIYGVSWAEIFASRLKNWWEKEISIDKNPQQPTMTSTHRVTRTNLVCTNRRTQCVLSTDVTMPA